MTLLFVAFTQFTASAQIGDISTFIKGKYGDEIDFWQMEDIGGAVITDDGETMILIGHYRYGTTQYLMLELKNEDMVVPEPYDILKIQPGQDQEVTYRTCRMDKKANSKIIALGSFDEDVEYYTNLTKAWVVNQSTMMFEETSTDGLDCENLSYGL